MLIKANSELIPDVRFETIQEINNHIIGEAPWIFLVVPQNIFGVHTDLQNWRIHPEGYLLYWKRLLRDGLDTRNCEGPATVGPSSVNEAAACDENTSSAVWCSSCRWCW